MYIKLPVSGHSATDKTPMYEMPRIFVFGGGVLGLGEHFLYWGFGCWHFVIGVLSKLPPAWMSSWFSKFYLINAVQFET